MQSDAGKKQLDTAEADESIRVGDGPVHQPGVEPDSLPAGKIAGVVVTLLVIVVIASVGVHQFIGAQTRRIQDRQGSVEPEQVQALTAAQARILAGEGEVVVDGRRVQPLSIDAAIGALLEAPDQYLAGVPVPETVEDVEGEPTTTATVERDLGAELPGVGADHGIDPEVNEPGGEEAP